MQNWFYFQFSLNPAFRETFCPRSPVLKMTETSPESQDTATVTAPAPDPAASGPEVEDHLPCVLHKTGALHSIVCWGENIITRRKCGKSHWLAMKSNHTSRLWQFVTIMSPSCSPWIVLSDILLDFCSVHKMPLALFMNIIAWTQKEWGMKPLIQFRIYQHEVNIKFIGLFRLKFRHKNPR